MALADGKEAVPRVDSMQRVRVGLTGLAFVMLIVALVSFIFNAASDEAPVMPMIDLANITQPPPVHLNTVVEEPKSADPISEIGVAPSSATPSAAAGGGNSSDPAPAPAGRAN
ncbi:hypothetical protein [Sphingomonas sanxanigenens]|uniref:Uncharacterized protein n=1 Tax=Sphingomonas sanxanigenens DSM 19645 = NX02 TaxID=1123269 RepID=W0A6D0_9SPHN|nr:hypothetical protein [Sphingomonas sanxanigenens]AHE51903.1 hypothetical protein NX02_00685 [Sphingomonas sanxanigenens DSM 19645 = NX02]